MMDIVDVDRWTMRTPDMNALSLTDYRMPSSRLDAATASIAGLILWAMDFACPAMAADQQADIALPTKSRAEQSGAPAVAANRAEGSAKRQSSGANDTYGRFQRDIVPHLDAAYNFARFLSRNPDAAQDIVQEAFLRAYRSFDGYQGGDARAWIFAIIRNCYQNWLLERRRKSRLEVDVYHGEDDEFFIDNVASEEDTPETALLRKRESSAVRVVLGKLPRSLREVLVLRELEGLSYRQIAETSALPIGTVMSRLARARTQFENVWRRHTGFRENQT
jgi:RNA polymerase sigma factor (sigma-70 family)